MNEQLPFHDSVRDRLLQASTATIATQLFRLGLRNTFLNGLLPVNPGHCRFAGEAATLRFIPMREDLDTLETIHDPDYPQRKAIESARPGTVFVIDSRGDTRAGTVGNILLTRLRVRGAVGLVTDGAVRDAPEIAVQPFPVFAAARSAAISLSVHHAVDFDVPIACAGVAVFPGDILAGDEEGVVVIPRHLAPAIAAPAAEQEALERFLLAKIEAGAPLPGTYPPNEQTLAEYAAWRRSLPSPGST
ncbi:MAG: ribonuclease activity regulator RraA [Chloroflexota bacterium]|nr:ribonuclease activity regulator RraA [Chloroflexia bacterium]MDQ3226824.1 ribonuclease activity regulator RraA [Chloroflexota bacterium]